jgi:Domain of unknown function (DUF4113)
MTARNRSRRRVEAIAAINPRMGRYTVIYAGSGVRRDWAAFTNMKSQQITSPRGSTGARRSMTLGTSRELVFLSMVDPSRRGLATTTMPWPGAFAFGSSVGGGLCVRRSLSRIQPWLRG